MHPPSQAPDVVAPLATVFEVLFGVLLTAVLGALVCVLLGGCVSLRTWEEVRAQIPVERFVPVTAPGGREIRQIHVERAGLGHGGTPLVLLHGFGGSSYSWRRVTPKLAERHPVLAPDLYGFGYTERPEDPAAYTRTGQVGLVLGLMDALGLEGVHLVGHSYGGSLAVALATRHPRRVRSLVLVDAAHPSYPQTRRRSIARLGPYNAFYVRVLGLRRRVIARGLERSYHDDELAKPEVVDAYLERLRVEGAVRAYRGLTVPQPDPGPEVELSDVAAPTLVLWGTEDPLISVGSGREATGEIPGATFVEIPEAGHAPHEERPAEVADRILAFLASLGDDGEDGERGANSKGGESAGDR